MFKKDSPKVGEKNTNVYTKIQGVYVKKPAMTDSIALTGLKKISKFIILKRNNPTKTKSGSYILDVSTPKKKYISSLYSTKTAGVFRAEYLGEYFLIDLSSPNKAVIKSV